MSQRRSMNDLDSESRRNLRAVVRASHPAVCFYCDVPIEWSASGQTTQPPQRATIDHINPVSRGGLTEFNNLVPACRVCNVSKGDMTGEEFLLMLYGAREKRAA